MFQSKVCNFSLKSSIESIKKTIYSLHFQFFENVRVKQHSQCFCSCIHSTVQMVAGQIQKLSLFS